MLPVKCRLEDGRSSETRLLMLRRLELAEFHCKLGWLFDLRGHYQFRYLDKFGDLITFSSEEEFQLALANHLEPEFRVLITPVEPSQVRGVNADAQTARSLTTRGSTNLKAADRGPADSSVAVAIGKDFSAAASFKSADTDTSAVVVKKPSVVANGGAVQIQFPDERFRAEPPAETPRKDWEAAFHPDYLRPRTSTSRRTGRRRPTLDVQASLAGYPPDVVSSAAGLRLKRHDRDAPPPPPPPPPSRPRPALPSASSGGDFVHFGIECSRCGTDPLIGWRFKCSQCPNYNLCGLCFEGFSHGHGFYRLP